MPLAPADLADLADAATARLRRAAPALADDLRQEAHLAIWRAWRHRPDLDRGLAGLIGRNAAIDALRTWSGYRATKRTLPPALVPLDALRADVVADPRQPPADDRAHALAALAALPEPDRSVTAWRLAGYELTEVGAALGVSDSRACQIMSRARARLRSYAREP